MTHKTLTLGRKLARLWDKKTESIITPTEHSKIILDSRFWFLYLSPSLDASSYGCNGVGLSHLFGGVVFFQG